MEDNEQLHQELARLKQLKAIQKKAILRHRKSNAKTQREIQIREATQEDVAELLTDLAKWEKKTEEMRVEHRVYKEQASALEKEYQHLLRTVSLFEEEEQKPPGMERAISQESVSQQVEGSVGSVASFDARSSSNSASSLDLDEVGGIDNLHPPKNTLASSIERGTNASRSMSSIQTSKAGARSIAKSLVSAGRNLKSTRGRGGLRKFVRSLSSDDLDEAFM